MATRQLGSNSLSCPFFKKKSVFFHERNSFAVSVLLDAPTGMSSDVWALVQPELAKITKVCVYDRAGLGFSERPSYRVTLYFSLIFIVICHDVFFFPETNM